MYLDHFGLKTEPFGLTPNTKFYCKLKTHEQILAAIMNSIKTGNGFIKVIGEVGVGKTLLCRNLLNRISDDYHTCYIPNPDLSPLGLRRSIADELGFELSHESDQYEIEKAINEGLVEKARQGKKIILLVDEAQALSNEGLETLRLITNLETETSKLLLIILFAQPELDERLSKYNMRQLMQRITYSFYLASIAKEELPRYLAFRLLSAGHEDGQLFTKKACKLLYRISKGWPRVLNIIADKSMLAAFSQKSRCITKQTVYIAIQDSFHVIETTNNNSMTKRWIKFATSIMTDNTKKATIAALLILTSAAIFNYTLYIYLLR